MDQEIKTGGHSVVRKTSPSQVVNKQVVNITLIYGGFTPWLPRVFRSFLNHVSKTILYVRGDSYVATSSKTISFPPSHGDVHFKYSFAFKKRSRKIVDCYTTFSLY